MDQLPAEVIHLIVDNIKLSSTIFCLKLASSKLSSSIASRRNELLFDQIYVLITPLLENHDMSNLKLVCKRWNNSIEMFVTKNPINYPLPKTLKTYGPTVAYGYTFNSPQNRHFEIHTTECFNVVKREIRTHFTYCAFQGIEFLPLVHLDDRAAENYWIEARNFVKEYGKYIERAVFGLVYHTESLKQLFNLASLFEFLPNLVSVRFVSAWSENYNTANALKTILKMDHMNANMFMHLRNLISITFESDSEFDDVFKTLILQTQVSVRKIEMGMWVFARIPKLTNLLNNVTDLNLYDVFSLVNLGNLLTKLTQNGSILRNLYINFTYKITTRDLFALVEDTKIEKLNAEFASIEDSEIYELISAPSLLVPSIVALVIDDTYELTSYDFLYWVPNLRYLTLRGKGTWIEEAYNNGQISRLSFNLKQCVYRLKAPDGWLWYEMPKLQLLTTMNDVNNFFENSVNYYRPIELSF